MRQDLTEAASGPSEDDLMAIADAVREVGATPSPAVAENYVTQEIGRRGHLRALPSN